MQSLSLWMCLVWSRVNEVMSHGCMRVPAPRSELNLSCTPNWYNIGCQVGCDECSNDGINGYFLPEYFRCKVNGVNITNSQAETLLPNTLPQHMRTYNRGNLSLRGDWTRFNPWRAPGASPITDPCGILTGYAAGKGMWPGQPYDQPMCTAYPNKCPPGYAQGTSGQTLPERKTTWVAGQTAEVGWQIGVNHGGGYQYRLCPKSQTATEACFQAMPLSFSSTTTKIHYSRTNVNHSISAKDISSGTVPAGSAWRVNPIPACNCDSGLTCDGTMSNTQQSGQSYQYNAPIAGHCRGVCGKMEGVNGRSKKGLDKAACQAACDVLGAQCIGYSFARRNGFCALHGANLENNLPTGWNPRALPTKDIAQGSGAIVAECVVRSTHNPILPKTQGVDYTCVANARGVHAQLIEAGRRMNAGTARLGGGNGTGGRGTDGGDYVEYFLNRTAYSVETNAPSRCSTGLQFPAPCAECYGYYDAPVRSFDIIDTVTVPNSPGDYLLSWRWDNEQSPQIWSNCADITIATTTIAPTVADVTSSTPSSRSMFSRLTLITVAFSAMWLNTMPSSE